MLLLKAFVSFVLSFIFLAGLAILPQQPKPEGEVYSVLREALYHGVHGDKMVVIDRAIAMPTFEGASLEWLSEFDDLPATLRQAASRQSPAIPAPLDSAIFPPGTRLVPKSGIDAVFNARGMNTWTDFAVQYGAEGWLSFSEVLFTPDRLDALVYYEAHCGGLCGEGGYAWLHRATGRSRWLLKKRIVRWMA